MPQNLLKGFIYSLISAASFGSLAIFVKLGYNSGLNVYEMLTYRFLSASAFLFIFILFFNRRLLKASRQLILKSFISGSIIYFLQSFCFFSSIKYISPSVTELILYLYPAVVTLFSIVIFKEKLTLFKIGYILVVLIGFAFIFQDAFHSTVKLDGILFALFAMLIYSVYLIFVQKVIKNENTKTFTLYTMIFAFLSFFIFSYKHLSFTLTLNQMIIIAFLGLIATAVAILFLYAAINIIGASLTSVFSSFEPEVTIVLSIIVLQSSMNKYQIIGGFLILLGVAMANIYHMRAN